MASDLDVVTRNYGQTKISLSFDQEAVRDVRL